MKNTLNRIVDLLTNKKRKVPLIFINFNYQKYVHDGAKGSCICSVHPELAEDEAVKVMLNNMVDYIRDHYDMEKLVEV